MGNLIPSYLYSPLYLWGLFFLCALYSFKIINYNNSQLIQNQNNKNVAIFLAIILILFLGLRPTNSFYFGDTINYARTFIDYQYNPQLALYDLFRDDKGEKIFRFIMIWFSSFTDVSTFFLFIEFIYIGGNLWATSRLFPNNPYAAFLVVLSSFSFYTYGINGIRNGAALAFVIVAISFIDKNIRSKIFALLLCLIAYGFHTSAILPVGMLIISAFIIKDFKWAFFFWIASIFISLTFGGSVANIFEGWGFDDRLDSYLGNTDDEEIMGMFSKTGFRWDFLLYSCVPILIGYYIIVKRKVRNKTYELILNTYTLTNAFWVMIIRAAFSNRFAYLSWFMYPLVLAYPFLRMNVWEDQSKKTALMIMANIIFSIVV